MDGFHLGSEGTFFSGFKIRRKGYELERIRSTFKQ